MPLSVNVFNINFPTNDLKTTADSSIRYIHEIKIAKRLKATMLLQILGYKRFSFFSSSFHSHIFENYYIYNHSVFIN